MLRQIQRAGSLGLLAVVTASSVGCMVTPGNGADIGAAYLPTNFSGYLAQPNQTVSLYALEGPGNWQYIGQANSSNTPLNHFGIDWYLWSENLSVPEDCWHYYADGLLFAIVQARNDQGESLFNFNEGFYDALETSATLSELWAANGHDGEAILILGD